MPNYCYNYVKISKIGTDERSNRIFEILRSILKERAEKYKNDRNKLISWYDILLRMNQKLFDSEVHFKDAYGVDNAIEYQYMMAGTKWDAFDSAIYDLDSDVLDFSFTSAWCIPYHYYDTIAKVFNVKVNVVYYVEGSDAPYGYLAIFTPHVEYNVEREYLPEYE